MSVPERLYPARVSSLPVVTGPPSPSEWNSMREQAEVIVRSGMAPRSVNTPEKVLVIAMKGRELALPPLQALSHIHIVEGKPTLSAELMAALVQRAGHKLRVNETTSERCVVEGVRADDPSRPSEVTFSMEDAKRAGVTGKGPWKQYPAAMLRARAISALCRFQFADVLMGASYTPEELGQNVNEEGEVVSQPAPVRPLPSSPASFPSDDGEMDLDDYLKEIVRVHARIPDHSRPPIERVRDYASQSTENARKSLAKLRKDLEASRGRGETEDVPDMDEAEDAEVVGDDGNPHEKALPARYRSGFDPDSYDIPDEDLDTERKENPDELQGR